MVLRTYFWSRPHVAEGGQVRFSVALTNETLGKALECMKSKGLRRHMTLPNSRCGQFLKHPIPHTTCETTTKRLSKSTKNDTDSSFWMTCDDFLGVWTFRVPSFGHRGCPGCPCHCLRILIWKLCCWRVVEI